MSGAVALLQRECLQRRFSSNVSYGADKPHPKKVTLSELERGPHIAGVRSTKFQMEELAAKRSAAAEGFPYHYQNPHEVNAVHTVKGLEMAPPLSPVATTRVPRSPDFERVETPAEVAHLEAGLAKITHAACVDGVVIKRYFQDFDRQNAGAVPLVDFSRGLNTMLRGAITPAQTGAVAHAYSQLAPTGERHDNYRRLHEDCSSGDKDFSASAMSRLARREHGADDEPEREPHWWQHMDVEVRNG